MSKLDLSRPVKTKFCERDVEILYILRDNKPIAIGYRESFSGEICTRTDWRDYLKNTPQKRSGWVNVYRVSKNLLYTGKVFCTEDFAKEKASHDAIATAYIEWEE